MKYIAMCNLTLQLIYDQYEDYFENILFMNDVLERERILYRYTIDILCIYFMFCTYRVFYYGCALRLAVTQLNGRAYCLFKRVFVDVRFCSAVKNRVRLLTSGSPGAPHKGIINASQSRCGAERIASIKCNFGRVPILNFG